MLYFLNQCYSFTGNYHSFQIHVKLLKCINGILFVLSFFRRIIFLLRWCKKNNSPWSYIFGNLPILYWFASVLSRTNGSERMAIPSNCRKELAFFLFVSLRDLFKF